MDMWDRWVSRAGRSGFGEEEEELNELSSESD